MRKEERAGECGGEEIVKRRRAQRWEGREEGERERSDEGKEEE